MTLDTLEKSAKTEFQLTRSRGAWLVKAIADIILIDFNSHAHVERDYTTGAGTAIVFNFNSHAHVERDILQAV